MIGTKNGIQINTNLFKIERVKEHTNLDHKGSRISMK